MVSCTVVQSLILFKVHAGDDCYRGYQPKAVIIQNHCIDDVSIIFSCMHLCPYMHRTVTVDVEWFGSCDHKGDWCHSTTLKTACEYAQKKTLAKSNDDTLVSLVHKQNCTIISTLMCMYQLSTSSAALVLMKKVLKTGKTFKLFMNLLWCDGKMPHEGVTPKK